MGFTIGSGFLMGPSFVMRIVFLRLLMILLHYLLVYLYYCTAKGTRGLFGCFERALKAHTYFAIGVLQMVAFLDLVDP